jgi:hypothetical protein
MLQTTLTPSMRVVERFSKVSSRDFEHELERIWDGIATVRESVVEAVRDDKLTPIEGISILACARPGSCSATRPSTASRSRPSCFPTS